MHPVVACDFLSVELLNRKVMVRCMVLFAMELSMRKVEILGVTPDPNGIRMEQVADNATCPRSFPPRLFPRYLKQQRSLGANP